MCAVDQVYITIQLLISIFTKFTINSKTISSWIVKLDACGLISDAKNGLLLRLWNIYSLPSRTNFNPVLRFLFMLKQEESGVGK